MVVEFLRMQPSHFGQLNGLLKYAFVLYHAVVDLFASGLGHLYFIRFLLKK